MTDRGKTIEQPVTASADRSARALHTSVADKIRNAILSGELVPGERLVEERLAREFGVSRHPVREALRTLQLEGFVEISPRRGATVSSVSPAEVGEMFEVLAALDGLAARLAAASSEDTTMAAIAALCNNATTILESPTGSSDPVDLERLAQLNREFHYLTARASGNRHLIDTITALRDRIRWIQTAAAIHRPELSWQEHRKVYEAIRSGGSDLAANLARSHIDSARKLYLETLSRSEPAPPHM